MKKNYLLIIMAAMSILAVSCSKEDEPKKAERYNFTSKEAIAMDLSVGKNDSYVVKEFEIDQTKLAASFGGTIPSNLLFYAINSDGSKLVGEDEYTSEYGFYFTSGGDVCMPSADGCAYFIEYYSSPEGYAKPTLGIGQYPNSCEIGDTLTLRVGLTDTITGQPFKLKITIKKSGDWAVYFEHADGLTYTVYETVNTEYKAMEVFINETALSTALGVASSSAIISGMSASTIKFIGINSDNSQYTTGYTANGYGHWFNADCNVCNWGAANNSSVFSEWAGAAPISFKIGQYVSGVAVGDSFDIRQAFVYGEKTVILTFKIRIVEEVTDDLGPDLTSV